MPKPRNYCAVNGCKSQKIDKRLSFFSLPKDTQRRVRWLELIGRPDLVTAKPNCSFVCSLHFKKSAIIRKPHLKPDAVPTKLLPHQPSTSNGESDTNEDLTDISTQTEESAFQVLSDVTIEDSDTKPLCYRSISNKIQTETIQTPEALLPDIPKNREPPGYSQLKRRKLQNQLRKIKQIIEESSINK